MPTYDVWDMVSVPFPYTNRPVRQRRPALVIAVHSAATTPDLLWVLMVTSAENRGWPGDVAVDDLERAGLSAASVVRTAKLATIEAAETVRVGRLSPGARAAVARHLQATLRPALDPSPAA